MPRFSDRAGSAEQLALTLPAASPSANVQDVGTPDSCSITRLNSPACTTPTDASPPPSRTADGRGRDSPSPVRARAAPAQIPACGTTALGSCLGYERRNADRARDAGYGPAGAIG